MMNHDPTNGQISMKRAFWIGSFVVAVGIFLVARNAASWRPQLLAVGRGKNLGFQFSNDGRWLLIQSDDARDGDFLWDWQNRRLARKIANGFYRFSPDGKFLARLRLGEKFNSATKTATFATSVEIYRTDDGKLVKAFSDSQRRKLDSLQDARWSADGKNLVVATTMGCRIFEIPSGRVLSRWSFQGSPRVVLSSGGTLVLRLLPRNSEVRDARTGQFLRGFPFDQNSSLVGGFSPDNQFCYSVTSSGNRHHLWRLSDGKLISTNSTTNYQPPHFLKKPDHLAFATPQGLEIRQFPGGKVVEKLSGPRGEPFEIAPDEKSAVSCDNRGKIWRWRLR